MVLYCIPVNASSIVSTSLTKLDAVEAKYSMETVSSINVYKDILKERLNSVELYYDLSEKMPKEALKLLEPIANIEKAVEELDNNRIQVTYTLKSKNPVEIQKFQSGNVERIYNVTSYSYIMKAKENTGSVTEDSAQSDITFRNTAYYSYYTSNNFRVLKLTKWSTKITRFVETKLRNLQLSAVCSGTAEETAVYNEKNSTTVASPKVGTTYSLNTGFKYHYVTTAALIQYKAQVTYSHGNSSYTPNSYITLGTIG